MTSKSSLHFDMDHANSMDQAPPKRKSGTVLLLHFFSGRLGADATSNTMGGENI